MCVYLAAVCREGWWQEDGSEIRPGEVRFTCLPFVFFVYYFSGILCIAAITATKYNLV